MDTSHRHCCPPFIIVIVDAKFTGEGRPLSSYYIYDELDTRREEGEKNTEYSSKFQYPAPPGGGIAKVDIDVFIHDDDD